MKKLYFLAGLPRSGSTLLGSILNQHSDIYVSPTSPLGDIVTDIEKTLTKLDVQYTYDKSKVSYNIYSSVLSNFYNHIPKSITIDKHRFWCKNLDTVQRFLIHQPKVIITYRPIPEVLTSYISLIERSGHENNFIDEHLRRDGLPITNSNRADHTWRYYVAPSYEAMITGMKSFPDWVHMVDYNDLVKQPQEELKKIYEFLEVESHQNDLNQIYNFCGEEKDEEWGLKGLHDIRPKLEKISKDPIEVIGEDNVKLYSKFNV